MTRELSLSEKNAIIRADNILRIKHSFEDLANRVEWDELSTGPNGEIVNGALPKVRTLIERKYRSDEFREALTDD